MRSDFAALAVLAFLAQNVFAQLTSLYVPGFDPQPLSADILGVDSQGRTTWALHAGTPTGTFEAEDSFPGTVTLVEGANDASETYVVDQVTAGEVCTFSGGIAVCSVDANGTPDVETETILSFAVQLGQTAAATGVTSSPTPTGVSQTSESSNSSSGSSSASSPSQTAKNSSAKHFASIPLMFGIITLFTMSML